MTRSLGRFLLKADGILGTANSRPEVSVAALRVCWLVDVLVVEYEL